MIVRASAMLLMGPKPTSEIGRLQPPAGMSHSRIRWARPRSRKDGRVIQTRIDANGIIPKHALVRTELKH